MPIVTCIDMIASAQRTAGIQGVGQTPLAEDVNDAFDLLCEITENWRRERFMAWKNVEEVLPSTGAQLYPLADRPPRLDGVYARLISGATGTYNAGPVDFPLVVLNSQTEYNNISLKSLTTFPTAAWYSPDFPFSTVWPWPIPPAHQFDLHVFYRGGLPTYTKLTDPLGLPPEYVKALRYELAILLQVNYSAPVNPALIKILNGTLATVKATNARVASLQMPAALVPAMPGQGGISGSVGPHQSVIVLDSGLPVLG